MSEGDEDVRNRSVSSPSLPPAWVLASDSPNNHVYEEVAVSSAQSTPYVTHGEELDVLRPKSVPPASVTPSVPPTAPPLPALISGKERRKYSRKYGSGLYSEVAREASAANSLSHSLASSVNGYPPPVDDPYQSSSQVYTTAASTAVDDSCTWPVFQLSTTASPLLAHVSPSVPYFCIHYMHR